MSIAVSLRLTPCCESSHVLREEPGGGWGTLGWRPPLSAKVGAGWLCDTGAGLSAIRAAAARHALVLDDLAIKVVLGLDNAAKEHPAVHAGVGAQALEAGVVRLNSVVVILSG